MFDAGACTVACRLKDPSEDQVLWTGTLGKGDSSPTFAGRNDYGELQIAVDANGVAYLSSPDDSWASAATFALTVTPQYNVSTRQTQIAAGSVPGISSGNTAQATVDGNVDGLIPATGLPDPLAQSGSIGTAGALTPSTFTFAALVGASVALWSNGS